MFWKEQSINPVKAFASLTCISLSPFVLIAVLLTSTFLNSISGTFTFCPKLNIGTNSSASSSVFIGESFLVK